MRVSLLESRSCERYRTHLKGWIVADQPQEPVSCTVWDLSETGVRLAVPDPSNVPVEFNLAIPCQGAAARVRLIWTDGYFFGAEFQD